MSQFITINDTIIKSYFSLKDSITSAPVVSALLCIRSSLVMICYLNGVDFHVLNSFLCKNLRFILGDKMLIDNIDVVSNNFVGFLIEKNQISVKTTFDNNSNRNSQFTKGCISNQPCGTSQRLLF